MICEPQPLYSERFRTIVVTVFLKFYGNENKETNTGHRKLILAACRRDTAYRRPPEPLTLLRRRQHKFSVSV